MTNRAYEEQVAEGRSEEQRSTPWNCSEGWLLDEVSHPYTSRITEGSKSSSVPFPTLAGNSVDSENIIGDIQVPMSTPASLPDELTEYDREMTRFASAQEEDLKRLLKEFVMENTSSTESFLKNHRSLVEVLLDSVSHLRRSFGGDTTLRLDVGFEEAIPTTIRAAALWKGSLASAREALAQFDESWWLENVKRGRGRIVFDYELA